MNSEDKIPTHQDLFLALATQLPVLKSLEDSNFQTILQILENTNQGNLAYTIDKSASPTFQTASPFFQKRNLGDSEFLYFQKDYKVLTNLESNLTKILSENQIKPIERKQVEETIENLSVIYRKHSQITLYNLTNEQKNAIYSILFSPFHLLVGGPGTGKTSVISFLLKVMQALEILPDPKDIVLVAPTGRAAQRLTESIQKNLQLMETSQSLINKLKGQTLHSLLKVNPKDGKPKFGKERYLPQKLFIFDEVSMVDLHMMDLFLEAMKPGNQVILLGDPNQLPSVEKGNVFSDLVAVLQGKENFLSQLTISKRFANNSHLSTISKEIQTSFEIKDRSSKLSEIPFDTFAIENFKSSDKNMYWLQMGEQTGTDRNKGNVSRNEILKFLWTKVFWPEIKTISQWKLNPGLFKDSKEIQFFETCISKNRCLTIFRNNYFGLEAIQEFLMELAEKEIVNSKNSTKNQILFKNLNRNFYFEGMPILVERNDHSRKLFNGDTGLVLNIEGELRGVFLIENNLRSFALDTLPNHSPAFFLTVHKSQGSEYERVFLYLPPTDETLNEVSDPNGILNRQILYTAITRAKNEVVLIGDPATWEKGLENYTKRVSGFQLVL